MFTRQIARAVPRQARLLSTTRPARAETIAGKVKETVKEVDKAAGRTLASGLESAQNAAESVKETLGTAQEKAPQAAAGAKEKLTEAQLQAEKAKSDVKSH